MFCRITSPVNRRLSTPWGFFGLGCACLLVAVALLAYRDYAGHHRHTTQHERLVQAVADLQGCANCHTMVNPVTAQVVVASVPHHVEIRVEAAADPASSETSLTRAGFDQRLAGAGLRVLELSTEDHSPAVEQAADEFLRLYEQSRQHESPRALWLDAQELARLEALLRLLEQPSSPDQWRRLPAVPGADTGAMMAYVSSASPPLAFQQMTILLAVPAAPDPWAGEPATVVPPQRLNAAHRRGPPAAVRGASDSVDERRLPVGDAQSSFVVSFS